VPATARQRALALLERARTSGFIEAGNWKAFYTLVSEALRGLAAALDARWSTDLTSAELIAEMRSDRVDSEHADTLEHLLRIADLAKFARRGRDPDDARRDLDEARKWVESFAVPEPEPAESAAVAAGVAP
jgi:DNA-binding transcriptional regulator YbjK